MSSHPRREPAKPFLDVFISHASEDHPTIASPLARALVARGYSIWISDHELVVGNSLPLKINEGLKSCRFGVAILSPNYLRKHWTMKELAALTSREESERRDIIIPVLHNLGRAQLTAELPLWAPALSETWAGNPDATAAAIARAIGAPTVQNPQPHRAFELARILASGELNLSPKHDALVAQAGMAVSAVGVVWRVVQQANRSAPKGMSLSRRRARAMMLAVALKTPICELDNQTVLLETAAAEYVGTLRRLLDVGRDVPDVNKAALVGLNEVFGGAVADTFSRFVALLTDKRAQAVTFPKQHSDLTRALDRVGEDLGRLSFAFEMLVEFCLSELPAKIRLILEG